MQSRIYIAGAHSRGQTFYEYVSKLYKDTQVVAFLVDDSLDNPSFINEIPVLKIEEGLDTEVAVYLATRGVTHAHLISELEELGFRTIIPVDYEIDIFLRNKYVRYTYEELGREFRVLSEDENTLCSTEKKTIVFQVHVFILRHRYMIVNLHRHTIFCQRRK